MLLFFDVETTGLVKDLKAPVTDHANFPRIVSISWERYFPTGKLFSNRHLLIKPVGFDIPEAATGIHGISTQEALSRGVDLEDALTFFNEALSDSTLLIAHNIEFDSKVVGAEFDRLKWLGLPDLLTSIPKFCTMEAGVEVCQIPGLYGYRWPKLGYLYNHLFGEELTGQHNSAADVAACAKCYYEMKKRELTKHKDNESTNDNTNISPASL